MTEPLIEIEIVDIDVDGSDKDDQTGLWRIPMSLSTLPHERWAKLFSVVAKCDEESATDCQRLELKGDRVFVWCEIDRAEAARTQTAAVVAETNGRYRTLKAERAQLHVLRDAVHAHAEGQHPKDAMHLSGEHRAVLGGVTDRVDRLLDDEVSDATSDVDRHGLAATLRESARHFGADHPDLTNAMDRVLEVLNAMGI